MSHKIIFIAGMPGAGKSFVADELVKQGFEYMRFGQIILDRVKERGLEVNEENERKIREQLAEEEGMQAIALRNIPKFDELLKTTDVVGDGLYRWSEYKLLKERYGDSMHVIAVYASPKLRYQRLENRKVENDSRSRFRSYTKEEARARDYAEIENIEKGGPIAMADYTIINIGTTEDLKGELNRILTEIDDQT